MNQAHSQSPANDESRREFVKKAAYVAPAILTLPAAPAYAKNGSEKSDSWQDKWDEKQDRKDEKKDKKDKKDDLFGRAPAAVEPGKSSLG